MLVKEYKLRPGMKHQQDGQDVQEGDTVQLTKSQAVAFRDKFEAVDSSDFKEVEKVEPYKPKAAEKTKGKEETGATKDAPQGPPVPQPPIHVKPPTPPEGPTDPHTLDPARQGQQSREQRAIIDRGDAPPPSVFAPDSAKPAAEEKKSEKK